MLKIFYDPYRNSLLSVFSLDAKWMKPLPSQLISVKSIEDMVRWPEIVSSSCPFKWGLANRTSFFVGNFWHEDDVVYWRIESCGRRLNISPPPPHNWLCWVSDIWLVPTKQTALRLPSHQPHPGWGGWRGGGEALANLVFNQRIRVNSEKLKGYGNEIFYLY
jgi:hypothetical protein